MTALFVGYLAASVYVCLPFIYWMTAPDWWKSRTGRSLMMLLASTAATFLLIASSGIFGAYPFRDVVRFVIYGSVLIAGLRLAFLFFQLRFGRMEDPKDGNPKA